MGAAHIKAMQAQQYFKRGANGRVVINDENARHTALKLLKVKVVRTLLDSLPDVRGGVREYVFAGVHAAGCCAPAAWTPVVALYTVRVAIAGDTFEARRAGPKAAIWPNSKTISAPTGTQYQANRDNPNWFISSAFSK